jgi:hypothetical protein
MMTLQLRLYKVRACEGTVLAKTLQRLSTRFNYLEMVERC